MDQANGYQCQFINSVSEDFYCKQCSLVARELSITNCCGDSYCSTCVQAVQEDNKPCLSCGKEDFDIFPHVKYQRKILTLEASCNLKEKGCGWSGPLEQLEAHLNVDTGDCEYIDIDCPLQCGQKISKKTLDHHTAKECVQRDYICPYCSFKGTYQIVENIHWPECSYLPLACPNRCGVTCERPTMEDHLKICPLQEVECQLKHVGCEEKFRREEEEDHMKNNSEKHLVMLAKTDILSKLQQQEQKIGEEEKRLEEQAKKIEEQAKRIEEQAKRIEEQAKRIEEQEKKIEEQEKIEEQFKEQEKQKRELKEKLFLCEQEIRFGKEPNKILEERTIHNKGCQLMFTVENFSREKEKATNYADWKTPPLHTHVCGYKFYVSVANWREIVAVKMFGMEGEYDDELQWPARVKFTVELINHFAGGKNAKMTTSSDWDKPTYDQTQISARWNLARHSELQDIDHKKLFLVANSLQFRLTVNV